MTVDAFIQHPATIAALSAVLSVGGTVGGFWITGYFSARSDKAKEAADDADKARKELLVFKDQVVESYAKLKDLIKHLESTISLEVHKTNGRIDLLAQQLKHTLDMTMRQEGKHDIQMGMLADQIKAVATVGNQLNALFRIVGAPDRQSDMEPPQLKG